MALREILAKFGFEVDSKPLAGGMKAADGLSSKLGNLATVMIGGALVNAGRQFISDLQRQADAIGDTARGLGVGTKELQQWQLAAKMSGAEAGDLTVGLKKISQLAADPKGSGEFKKLGISLKDAGGQAKTSAQLMGDIGLEIAKIPDPTARTAKALEVFGKSGYRLLPMFADGEKGLSALLGKLDEFGGGLGDDAIDVLQEAGDRFDEWDTSILSLKSRLAVALFPTLNKLVGWLTRGVGWLTKAAEGSNIFKAAVVVLGAAGAAAGVKALLPWLPMLAAFAILILLVDDLITLFEGGDSAIGRFVDSLFGVGTAKEQVDAIKSAWNALMKAMDGAPSTGKKANIALKSVGAGVEEAFSIVGEAIVAQVVQWADDLTAPGSQAAAALTTAMYEGLVPMPIRMALEGVAAVQGFINGLIKEGLKLVQRGAELAASVVSGFVGGIADGTGAAVDAITGWGNKIEAALRKKFGWHSPADMTFDLAYEGLMGGAVKGLEAGEPALVKQASGSLGVAVPGGARGGGGGGPIMVDQRNQIQVNLVAGPGAAGLQSAARQGISQGLADERRSLLHALEPVAPDSPIPS